MSNRSASESFVLKRYIDALRKKHQEDPDYVKWDLSQPLPKLPVPELKLSIEKYLRCVMPIVSDEVYANTEQIARKFVEPGGLGEQLQSILYKRADELDNWAYDWWLSDMYLLNKLALPINSNPGMIFPKEDFQDDDAQLKFTARLISGIMDYKIFIDDKELPVDRLSCREKGQPLCMEQYYRLFTSYRAPGVEKDNLTDSSASMMLEPEHIIVISRNQMYVLDVMVNFTRLSDDQLFHQLKHIKAMSENEEDIGSDIGFLTSLPRNEWAEARAELLKNPANKDCLDKIERCCFVVCLDQPVQRRNVDVNNNTIATTAAAAAIAPAVEEEEDGKYIEREMTTGAYQMIHGCNSTNNSGNRWFDKTIQFIISQDGYCGLNYEHSPAEGIVVIELSEHLFRYLEEKRKQKFYRMPSICELSKPVRLKWKSNDLIDRQIKHAKTRLDQSIHDLDLRVYKYKKFGRDFPKKCKMSPDSFVQLAMQLSYYKLYNKLVSTYESASTRRFRKGRVDNIRANSCEALAWVKSMSPDSTHTKEERFRLFQKAVQYQTDLMIDNILGKGMDCHLMALKKIADENGFDEPDLFTDESYRISNHFSLSTSQIPTSIEGSFMCYGPVVPNGYGCSYNPKPGYILFVISAWKSCESTNTRWFAESLEKSLDEMFDLCSQFVS